MKQRLNIGSLALPLAAPAAAVLIAVAVSAIALAAIGKNPFAAVTAFVDFGSTSRAQMNSVLSGVNRAVPLFLAGLAVAVGFRMGLFNIGVEGQYRMAAILAAAVGAVAGLPGPLNILLVIVMAALVGAGWAAIPAMLKVTRGISEVISTIMFNFVAIGIAAYLLQGPLKDPNLKSGGNVSTRPLPADSWMPDLSGLLTVLGLPSSRTRLDGFIVIAIVIAGVLGFVLSRTRFGFDLRASGLSPSAAQVSGIGAKSMVVKTMLLSGALAGLIGLPQLLGQSHSYGNNFMAGLGFTGIAVALVGRNTVVGTALGALLFAFLDRASTPLQFQGVPSSVVTIMQGLMVLSVVIANEVVRRFTLTQAERAARRPAKVAEPVGGKT